MTERTFRFGVVTGLARTGADWTAAARQAEQLGYDTLLLPDTLNTLAPFPALAAAATSTQTLRVGTYVLSAANRSPGLVAWETASLDFLTAGRFELGLGAGRPGADRDATTLGTDFGTPAQRLRQIAETIQAVTDVRAAGPQFVQRPHPPILIAASKPRTLELAAEHADIIALSLPPQAASQELAATVTMLRDIAGTRFDALELHVNVAAVAESSDTVPERVSHMVRGDPRAMAAAGGIAFLIGTPPQIADTLRRRRDEFGISYIAINARFIEEFAPIIALLRATD
jgi:probable F420-dependent oxidoreductase